MRVRHLVFMVVLGLSACTHTREAYKSADSPDEYAYVLAEHYASLLNQAADLKEKPTTPREAVTAMQQAELAARPVVDKLRPLRTAYLNAKNAQTQLELQEAINAAVLLIADLVRSVRAAAGEPSTSSLELRVLHDADRLRLAEVLR